MARRRPRSDDQPLWRVAGFGEEQHPPGSGYRWDNRGREPADMVVFQITLHGRMIFRERRATQAVPEGSAVLFAYNEASSYGLDPQSTEVYRTRWMTMRGAGLPEHWADLRRQHGSVIDLAGNELLAETVDRLYHLAAPRGTNDLTEMARAVHELVMGLYRHTHEIRFRVQSPAERAIEQILRNQTFGWSLKQVAAQHGVSREHLTRVFTERLGKPPAQVLGEARMRRAMHLLRNTDLPVYQVARQAGFASAHALARRIRQATGRSPRAVRQRTG